MFPDTSSNIVSGKENYVRRFLYIIIILFSVTGAHAETIQVKYLGKSDISSYKCVNIKPGADVRRICFNKDKKHLIVKLDKTYYKYCNMTEDAVTKWISASVLSEHYRNFIQTNTRMGRTAFRCADSLEWKEYYKNLTVVKIKYRRKGKGMVDLTTFDCPKIKNDKRVHRICYHANKKYMVALIDRYYFHYCAVGPNVYKSWISASSLEMFYQDNIRVSSSGGLYDCRGKKVPEF